MAKLVANGKGDILLAHYARYCGVVYIVIYVSNSVRKPDNSALKRCGRLAVCVAFNSVSHLKGQIKPFAVLFKKVNNSQALSIMLEADGADRIKRSFARVTEWGMPQIVTQGDCLG